MSTHDLLTGNNKPTHHKHDPHELEIIARAFSIMENKAHKGENFLKPNFAGEFFCLRLGLQEREVFAAAFLTNRHVLIEYEELFKGTLNEASIYPREVAKRCLEYNAAAIIVAHNHPSGEITPSFADRKITETLQAALRLIEVRMLDHIIVSCNQWLSFSEEGLM